MKVVRNSFLKGIGSITLIRGSLCGLWNWNWSKIVATTRKQSRDEEHKDESEKATGDIEKEKNSL